MFEFYTLVLMARWPDGLMAWWPDGPMAWWPDGL